MAILFFVLIVLAGYHYFVENIVVPTYQLELKEKLIGLKLRLYQLKEIHGKAISDDVFNRVDDLLTLTILNIENHNFLDFLLRAPRATAEIKQKNHAFTEPIRGCQIKEVDEIFSRYVYLLKRLFVAGTSGWLLYISPFILIFYIARFTTKICRKLFFGDKNDVEFIIITEKVLNRYQQFEKTTGNVLPRSESRTALVC